jgi:hypothetical protein
LKTHWSDFVDAFDDISSIIRLACIMLFMPENIKVVKIQLYCQVALCLWTYYSRRFGAL